MASIIGEISYAFSLICRVGESKRENFRDKTAPNGMHYKSSDYLHNHTYIQKQLRAAKNFGKWAREQGVKSIYQLKPEHHKLYIQHQKDDKGNSPGQLSNLESMLGILQRGMNMVSELRGMDKCIFFKKRTVKNNKKPENRSYKKEEISVLRENLSKNCQKALDLSVNLGLRDREACNIRVEHFVKENGQMRVYIPNKKDAEKLGVTSANGITKGARERHIPVPEHFESRLNELLAGLEPKDRVVGLKEGTLRQGLKRACEKSGIKSQGWHGFRHTFARERLDELFEKTGMGADCRTGLEIILKNRDEGKNLNTGFSGEYEKEVFEAVRECTNQVNEELGHGEDRWALVEVYMRD